AKLLDLVLVTLLCLLFTISARAQAGGSSLTGVISDTAGKAVPNAKVSVKNNATGQTAETQTDSAGHYTLPNLAPGAYEIDISAEGYSTNESKVTMVAGANQTMNWTIAGVLSLQDLGFSQAQTEGSAAEQARLNKRSHMLQIHQKLGLIAAIPIFASVITGTQAGGKSTSSADRYAHLALGAAACDLYFMSAYYAIRAPRIPGTHARGPIRLHKALAWIHGPGMILTPILGALAYEQKSKGERLHGLARAHGAVAIVTAAAYGAAILSVSFKF
ncbi:MAG: carboxypeptidase-like regulatory domain-containing protein, partial [Candidatus Acidiferrales bacterium]